MLQRPPIREKDISKCGAFAIPEPEEDGGSDPKPKTPPPAPSLRESRLRRPLEDKTIDADEDGIEFIKGPVPSTGNTNRPRTRLPRAGNESGKPSTASKRKSSQAHTSDPIVLIGRDGFAYSRKTANLCDRSIRSNR